MAMCPNCGKKIPMSKLLYIRTSIKCPACGSILQWKNKGTSRLIGSIEGGAGGGLGAFFGGKWVLTGNIGYLILVFAVMVAVFFTAWTATVKFTRFKLKERV
jgi:DNA-directed RNA polymerase subunit RPC12/RpoP